MLTAKQHELLLFIQRKLEESGISPSFEEMKEALDLKSKSGVHRLISALEERGFIRRLPNRARALEVLRQPEDVAPARAVANANDTVTKITTPPRVAPALLGAGEHYALEVSGDSMIEAGILDGDYALVRKTTTARDGEIVVALVRDEEATLKYLRHENGMIRLDPANASYDPQFYPEHEVQVQGKLAGLLRRYH